MKLLITCFKGTAPVLSQELKIMGYKTFDNFPTGMYIEGGMEDICKINLESRIANKVYMELGSDRIENFDQLFDFVYGMDREKYIGKGHKIAVTTNIFKSKIDSQRSTQSIVNKAIIKKLVGDDKQRMSDPNKDEVNIFVQIIENKCSIFVNTSGESLHNRGYREDTGDAPLKENLSASLIRLCNRHFKAPLLDPMCGSGTICIEAAMIAKNIAPGLNRKFTFQNFVEFEKEKFEEMKNKLRGKIFEGDYKIVGNDIDDKMIRFARQNAVNAGVDDIVIFEKKDISETKKWDGYVVCNPPYGKRMDNENMELLYKNLIEIYENGASGCFISSREPADRMIGYDFKIKNLNNNGEDVKIYLKK
ncbi:MAG TPA: THUMP domain-containing protein [Candidatus Absconditabacterales bacterium]|nr:THUMP domain-containing protein [Candidatus Absconditabacterales bacterium]